MNHDLSNSVNGNVHNIPKPDATTTTTTTSSIDPSNPFAIDTHTQPIDDPANNQNHDDSGIGISLMDDDGVGIDVDCDVDGLGLGKFDGKFDGKFGIGNGIAAATGVAAD